MSICSLQGMVCWANRAESGWKTDVFTANSTRLRTIGFRKLNSRLSQILKGHLICGKLRDKLIRMSVENAAERFRERGIPQQIAFHRKELSLIMSIYGRMVAASEWRDYGISCLREVAVFSVFRRTAEHPMYRIEKRPKLKTKQGQYSVISMDGQILKRGNDLKSVLRILEKKLIRVVD